MLNHYRTLILNLPDQGNSDEFISPGFPGQNLPEELQSFYNLLFPLTTSRSYKLFLYYCYEQLLHASGRTEFLRSVDSRISYTQTLLGHYFNLSQVSRPTSTTAEFGLLLNGTYQTAQQLPDNTENFVIQQVGTTSAVTVYSVQQKLYFNGLKSSALPGANMQISLIFTGNVTNVFPIGNTGMSAEIAGVSGDFTNDSNTWSFSVQTPFVFDFNGLMTNLQSNTPVLNEMFDYGMTDITSYNLWTSHYNPVYRFAGLLNDYFVKVNALWPTR